MNSTPHNNTTEPAQTPDAAAIQPVDVAAVRRQAFEEAACRLDTEAEEAIIRSDNCSDDMFDEFHDDAQHFKQSAAIVRALSAEPAQGDHIADVGKMVINGRLPKDVINLVIAARDVAYGGHIDVAGKEFDALDKALEVFSERIDWDEQPDSASNICVNAQALEEKRNRAAFNLTIAIREMTEGEWEPSLSQSFDLLDAIPAPTSEAQVHQWQDIEGLSEQVHSRLTAVGRFDGKGRWCTAIIRTQQLIDSQNNTTGSLKNARRLKWKPTHFMEISAPTAEAGK